MDIYTPVVALQDYYNEWSKVSDTISNNRRRKGIRKTGSLWGNVKFEELRDALKQEPIQTIEQRYLRGGKSDAKVRERIKEHSGKVEYLNKLANIANTCADIVTYKRVLNEVVRVLYGKDRITFEGDEYDSKHLNL